MKKSLHSLLLGLTLIGLVSALQAADAPAVIAKVGDKVLTEQQMQDDLSMAMYNQQNQIYQMKIDWINPHTYMHFDVTEDGVLRHYAIESLGILGLRRAGIAFALSHAAGVSPAESEIRHFDLRYRDADVVFSLFADQLSLRDVFLQVLLDLAPHDLAEAQVVLFDI